MPRSNKKWCAHPISHQGSRKLGPGALCPRGDRPIDSDLDAFITQEYYQADAIVGFALCDGELLRRTCYETETSRFHTHLGVHVSSPSVDSPISAGGHSMIESVEMRYKFEQAKELLNQVFDALGIAKIRDVRQTNQLDKQVTTAIELIRSAAEALRHVQDVAQLPSHSSPKLADKEYLLDGSKCLIKSSDPDEQIRLLTLAPPEWGCVKVEEYFEISRYLAQKSISLRVSYGRLAVPVDWRGNTCLEPLLVQEIIDFYNDDAISRQSPNKRDVIHIQKNPIAIRHMSMTVGQAYQLFVQQLQAKQGTNSVKKSSFYNLRPKWIKIKKPHDVCTCIYHENFELHIQSWNNLGVNTMDMKSLIAECVCFSQTETCYFRECDDCKWLQPGGFLFSELVCCQNVTIDDSVAWMTWKSAVSSKRVVDADDEPTSVAKISMQRVSGSIRDLLDEFDVKWTKFAIHHYCTRQQQEYIKKIKEEACSNATAVVQMDFAENPALIVQHEIQQANWTTPQATIFTVHITVDKTIQHSLAFVSDHLDHNIDFVHAAQKVIVQFIRDRYSAVKRVNYVTDGAPQHFKSNKSMLNLTYHESAFGIPAVWTFSATAHGKGPVDGIGAALKYRATRRVLSGRRTDTILTPQELYQFASPIPRSMCFILVGKIYS
ncbi:unnamed protein product [Adineta ricciae]|uniref:Uncharacterized protein n=1 Tax=Adineta ricciae TaxID=249248 RepID=A0A815WE35_ADIRI|nr:unnamed protein product [Adineta ricciae]CAF1596537.1 unnamed protein product [Adineta ricciae]